MEFNYKKLESLLDLSRYDRDLSPKLIGIGHEYDKQCVKNNEKIFTGKMGSIKFPKGIKESLQSQRFATALKAKMVEDYKGLYSRERILHAIASYKP